MEGATEKDDAYEKFLGPYDARHRWPHGCPHARTTRASTAHEAQQPEKLAQIGILEGRLSNIEILVEELQKYGWVEGQNLLITYRFAEGKVERLPALATELSHLPLDLLVTVTTTATRAALQVIKSTPIVFTVVADPVASGFVTNLPRPGGNATGLSGMGPQLAAKRLELLQEVVPTLSRVAVLWEPTNPDVVLNFHGTQRGAQALGLTLQALEVRRRDDFAAAFAAVTQARPDALVPITAPLTVTHDRLIAAFALHHRLATIAGWRGFVRSGGLMSMGPTSWTITAALHHMWIRFSEGPSRGTYRWSNRRGSSW